MSPLLTFHLITIAPVLVTGPFIINSKGKGSHKVLGRIWVLLMVTSCLSTFGIKYNGQFSWLHGLSAFTLYSVVSAVVAIKRADLKKHKRAMTGAYLGALIAFVWAVAGNGRLLNRWVTDLF